jgi:hypothetical protein
MASAGRLAPDSTPGLGELAPCFGNERRTYMRPFSLTGQPALSLCNGFDDAVVFADRRQPF